MDVREHFPEIENMEVGALYERRSLLIASAPNGDTNQLDDNALAELLQIARTLRRKAASPGGVGRSKSAKRSPATAADLA